VRYWLRRRGSASRALPTEDPTPAAPSFRPSSLETSGSPLSRFAPVCVRSRSTRSPRRPRRRAGAPRRSGVQRRLSASGPPKQASGPTRAGSVRRRS